MGESNGAPAAAAPYAVDATAPASKANRRHLVHIDSVRHLVTESEGELLERCGKIEAGVVSPDARGEGRVADITQCPPALMLPATNAKRRHYKPNLA